MKKPTKPDRPKDKPAAAIPKQTPSPHDVTDRKPAEEVLRESEARYRALF